LFLYTDGLSESLDGTGNEYGPERLSQLLNENNHMPLTHSFALQARVVRFRRWEAAWRRFDTHGDQAHEVALHSVGLDLKVHEKTDRRHLVFLAGFSRQSSPCRDVVFIERKLQKILPAPEERNSPISNFIVETLRSAGAQAWDS